MDATPGFCEPSSIFSLRDGEMYFLTQTLKPDYHVLNVVEQVCLTLPGISRILSGFSKYRLVSEFTKAGVIHYHVIGQITDSVKYWKTRNKLREYGFSKFEKPRCVKKCHEYLDKDLLQTIERLPEIVKDAVQINTFCCPTGHKDLFKRIDTYLKEKEFKEKPERIAPPAPRLQMQFQFQRTCGKLQVYLG